MASDGNNIRVVCRFRPQNGREVKEEGGISVAFDDDYTEVKLESREYPGQFTFDRIFDWNHNQKQVFDYSAQAVVQDVMKGYNGTIFAYGQTGAGKTFTMMGNMENPELKGMTPRIVESIFSTILQAPSTLEFTVKVSFMEIYMEKIRDLLNPSNDNLPIHEEKVKGVYVKGLLEVFVGSVAEVYQVMQQGMSSRVTASTGMNTESSRSHSIFVLQISQRNLIDGSAKTGKLFLVDLAGSEKVGKTGATGQTLEEAKKINKSLSALGNVINALTDSKAQHVPYRDSKLTRILQESLGGNAKTTLVINCSPSSFNEAETLSTLRFGMRAKTIKNKAKVNVELSPAELKVFLRKAKSDIVILRNYTTLLEGELDVWRSGGNVAQADWATAEKAGVPLDLLNADDESVAASPTRPPSVNQLSIPTSSSPNGRPNTPFSPPLDQDEREEFLKRENELTDQLAEKETELKTLRTLAASLQEEMALLKSRESDVAKDNKELTSSLNEIKLQMEKLTFEQQESGIVMDTLKDSNETLKENNAELKNEIDLLKTRVQQAQKTNAEEQNREVKKQEKITQMIAEYGPDTEKEREMRASLNRITSGTNLNPKSSSPQTSPKSGQPSPWPTHTLQHELVRVKSQLSIQELMVDELSQASKTAEDEVKALRQHKDDLERKYSSLEKDYQRLLGADQTTKASSDELSSALSDLKSKLETQYHDSTEHLERQVESLKSVVAKKEEEITTLQQSGGSKDVPDASEITKMQKTMADWDAMKTKLMIDLENRCQKVVELEIALDEAREQYNALMRNTNSKAQQQKMAFLERNLEQLTNVQKQLVEQNTNLKKEMAVAERKLIARNDRIQTLEQLLVDTQNKLEAQTQRFESELGAMRDRLQEARTTAPAPANLSWMYSAKIAKPLRGGGGGAPEEVMRPSASEQSLDSSRSDLGNGAFTKCEQFKYVTELEKEQLVCFSNRQEVIIITRTESLDQLMIFDVIYIPSFSYKNTLIENESC
ncbi:hypothetical protein SmJEL517_g01402 [Synchytrium microbalum]|uniref:Kinesin motor domain-containing protein n=1 Tax=Synchytrium microbalum TaxID=1806994 RepID=A0A507C9W7_9FUNG|nr:uncharacterized protein SmJEL517_g01402 [Synchytrium microbalum]TPX36271.1 hypothetical protein SmJEL517_g01402 [Synchytrium microbalum]